MHPALVEQPLDDHRAAAGHHAHARATVLCGAQLLEILARGGGDLGRQHVGHAVTVREHARVDQERLAANLTKPVPQPGVLLALGVEGSQQDHCCHRSQPLFRSAVPDDCRVLASGWAPLQPAAHASSAKVDRARALRH